MNGSFHEQLAVLCTSPVFLAALSSWFCAQFVKTLIKLFSGKVNSFIDVIELIFWRTGSMPSSHSALVASLFTTIGFHSGFTSDIFVLAGCFFLVTVRDALGVRRAAGIQARSLNELGEKLNDKGIVEYKKIKEIQGHSPLEVFVGSLLGFFIGLAFSIL